PNASLITTQKLSANGGTYLFLADLNAHTTGNTPDLTLDGTFGVSAIFPGVDSGIPLANANIVLKWDHFTDPSTISVTAGLNGASFLDFLKIDPNTIRSEIANLA